MRADSHAWVENHLPPADGTPNATVGAMDEHTIRELSNLVRDATPGGEGEALLQRVRHDLNNPLSTLSIELFSLGRTVDQAREALQRHDSASASKGLDTLADIAQNLDSAQSAIRDIAASMSSKAM